MIPGREDLLTRETEERRTAISFLLRTSVSLVYASVFMLQSFILRGKCLILFLFLSFGFGQDRQLEPQFPRERLPRGTVDHPGTAAWLIQHQPEIAEQRGRALFQRAFTAAEGASSPLAARPLSSEKPPRLDFAPSCMQCHNVPFGEPGAGITTIRDAITVRSTPHLFGAGQLDQLAQSVGIALVRRADVDNDGIISREEARGPAMIEVGFDQSVYFGDYGDANGDGLPDLDPAVVVWFVDSAGQRRPGGSLRDADIVGYCLTVRAFGAGGTPHAATGTTLRAAIIGAFALHAGLQAHDPIVIGQPHGGGWAEMGAAGVRQVHAGLLPDLGLRRDDAGLSVDDPDRDGVAAELLSGDIDVMEWFLSRHSAPRERTDDPLYAAGRAHFKTFGCSNCHVPDWQIGVVQVSALYSDLRSHDLGPAFHERQSDGRVLTQFRTTPLWGAAHSAPYGHDGASLDLEAVINRHAGEAAASQRAFATASPADRAALMAFLRCLVLE